MTKPSPNPLLIALGSRLRRQRMALDLTQRDLAQRCGLSARFLADVEAGRGNIALTRLATLALALRVSLESLVIDLPSPVAHCGVIALLGMRGAGKSTLGGRLADRLGLPFMELDDLIEEAAGMALREVFTIHGQQYFAELARECLDRFFVAGERSVVLATTGDIVGDKESYEVLQRRTKTIWLAASAEDHWQRVLDQGDYRPISDRPNAFGELQRLLARREPAYSLAQHKVDTSELGLAGSVDALVQIVAKGSGA